MTDVAKPRLSVVSDDSHAAAQLLPLVYAELRRLAARHLSQEAPGHTLQPTALVHEAYLRLLGPAGQEKAWNNRGHFFGAAAEAMRRILVENARRKRRLKHGGGRPRVDLDDACRMTESASDDLLALDEALARLALESPAKAELVKLRYFAGLTLEQSADAMNISLATAKRYWAYSRAWLYNALEPGK